MKQTKLTLFESTAANFRLSLETMYEKTKQDGTTQSTVYINQQKETGTFRPSCFLVFTYLTDDFTTTKGIYTTVPHMYKIRKAFEEMHSYVTDTAGIINIEGVPSVAPGYAQPIVVDNINIKNQDWLSLQYTPYDDPMTGAKVFGVAIQHSKSNGYSSLLTIDEFKVVYDLIEHMDFVSVENQAVMIELLSRVTGGAAKPQPTYNNYQQTYQRSAPQATAAPRPNFGRTAAPTAAPSYQTPVASAKAAPTTNPLPPRPASAPKISMANVQNIEVDDLSIDDSDAINDIFNSEE